MDVTTGDYEIADEDLEASERLLKRRPDALLFGQPIGEPGRPSARIGGGFRMPARTDAAR